MSADAGRFAALNAALDRLLWEGKDRTWPRWWGTAAEQAAAREQIRELAAAAGRELLWVVVDLSERTETVEPI